MSDITTTNISPKAFDLDERLAAQNRVAPGLGDNISKNGSGSQATRASFADTLRAANHGIVLSGHAQTRLASRNINLSEGDYAKISDAMSRASAKGAKSSLVLLDSDQNSRIGLVVSVPNRTVITAVDTQALKDNIFTNIDSALII